MSALDTLRAQGAIRILEVAGDRIDRGAMLAAAGLSEADLLDPDRRIVFLRWIRLWKAVCAQIPNPDFGLEVGLQGRARAGGVLGFAMLHSPTLGNALRRFARYSRLIMTNLELDLDESSDTWTLRSRRANILPQFRQPIDAILAGLLTTARSLTHRRISPVEIRVTYSEPKSLDALRRVYGSAEVLFGRPRGSIVFAAEDMEWPVVNAEIELGEHLKRLAEHDVGELEQVDSWRSRIAAAIRPRLTERVPDLADIADEISISPRTLQRRLSEEGTTFRMLVTEVRRAWARLLLEDSGLAVSEVAYVLGYSDVSSFNRAFKLWYGASPRRFSG